MPIGWGTDNPELSKLTINLTKPAHLAKSTQAEKEFYFLQHSGQFVAKMDEKVGMEFRPNFPMRLQRQETLMAATIKNQTEAERYRKGHRHP